MSVEISTKWLNLNSFGQMQNEGGGFSAAVGSMVHTQGFIFTPGTPP